MIDEPAISSSYNFTKSGPNRIYFLGNSISVHSAMLAILTLLYTGSRIFILDRLPVFFDEAMHIEWARQTLHGNMAAGLEVSKWLPVKVMALLLILPIPALDAVRLSGVLSGFATFAACVAIGRRLYSPKVGYLAGIFYVLLPFTMLYDRLALADEFVTAFCAWSLWCSLMTVRSRNLIYPTLSAACIVGLMLSKVTGLLLLPIPLLSIVLASRSDRTVAFRRIYPSLAIGTGLFVWLLWIGAGNGLVAGQSTMALNEIRVAMVAYNLQLTLNWYWVLLTPPITLFLGLALIARRSQLSVSEDRVLWLAFFIPAVPYIMFANVWYPRYMLFSVVPAAILSARFTVEWMSRVIEHIKSNRSRAWKLGKGILWLTGGSVLLLLPVSQCLAIIVRPESAALPEIERRQYVTSWSAGYGLPELAKYLSNEASQYPKGINVLRFGYSPPPSQGLDVYLESSESLTLYTLNLDGPSTLALMSKLSAERHTFLVLNPPIERLMLEYSDQNLATYVGSATRSWQYFRPGGSSSLEVWELSRSQSHAKIVFGMDTLPW